MIYSKSVSGLNNPLGLCLSTHFVLLYVVVDEEDDKHMIIILQTTVLPPSRTGSSE